jgi:hypothetical protein
LGAVLVALRTETGVAERLTILTAFLTAALAGTLACRRLRWGMTAALTFAALLIAVHELLPGYHRRFSLRGPVQEQSPNGSATAPRGATTSTAVYCYPRRWDSVSFYLGRDDVRAFAVEERPDLMAQLTARPRSVLFVKTRYLEDVVRDLPPDWEFVATRRTAWVTTGEVRRRDAAEGLASRR